MILAFVPLIVHLLSLLLGYDDAELLFAGDAMQHQAQIDAARRAGGTWDYSSCFEDLKPAIEDADFAVVNLETPLGEHPHTGYPCFNAPAAWAEALADAGFDLLLTANNHTLDRRDRGLLATIDSLDRRDIRHIGTYKNADERSRALPAIFNINNIRVGFLNYTYGTNGISPGPDVRVDYIDRRRIAADVAATRKAGAEIVCVCMHWGDEYRLRPNAAQVADAKFLEELGVDIIAGGHPHTIQPLEFRDNRYHPHKKVFIIWSLGNFISNMKTADTRGGLIARVRLHRGEDGVARVEGGDYEPIFTLPAGAVKGAGFKVVPARNDSLVPAGWRGRRDEFLRRADAVFDKYNIGVSER
ncbi:MAG: CapA family protein [Muribaculaceae bacterium]|nr:CapA family protein [Muribaculaceae bacterium]